MRYHCRCNKCRSRQTLKKHPDEYVRPVVCKSCDAKGSVRIDKWAQSRPWRKNVCNCDGYWFPHRLGSKFCCHNPNPVDLEEYREFVTSRI